jgi:hypothetical protein
VKLYIWNFLLFVDTLRLWGKSDSINTPHEDNVHLPRRDGSLLLRPFILCSTSRSRRTSWLYKQRRWVWTIVNPAVYEIGTRIVISRRLRDRCKNCDISPFTR